jgi:hypothetical protein
VHSPTFALVNIYSGGRLTLFHWDLYRLDTRQQIAAAGLEDYLNPAGVTVIEWAERWFPQVQSLESGVQSPRSKVQSPQRPHPDHRSPIADCQSPITSLACPFRRVQMEVLSETERRFIYDDDSGA